MSRTDHHRPYRVRVADPLTPGRYLSNGFGFRGQLYEPEWELPYSLFVHPPRDARRVYFHGPQRASVRVWARAAACSYNSGVEIPLEPDGRARNSVKWLWW